MVISKDGFDLRPLTVWEDMATETRRRKRLRDT